MILVKINRSSIKKNPNAGRTTYMVPGMASYKITNVPIIDTDCHREEISTFDSDGVSKYCNYYPNSQEQFEEVVTKLQNSGKDISMVNCNVNRPINTIKSLIPDPEWLYEYEYPEVECKVCNRKFNVKDIDTEYDCDEDGEEYAYERCPLCNHIDPLEDSVVYEKIQDVITHD